MKMQGITENNVMTGASDVREPKNEGIPVVQGDLKQPGDTAMAAINQQKSTQSKSNGIPEGLLALMQIKKQQVGLQEFETLQNSPQVDMGNIKSRDLGNMLSGELVRIGEAAAKAQNPGVDFGNLPSRALTEMGKDVIKSE